MFTVLDLYHCLLKIRVKAKTCHTVLPVKLNIYMYISNELHTFCFLLYFIQDVYSIVISLIVKK